ncbi:MAG: LamG domain-containing protein [Acidobacteriota bacterium]
MLRALALATLAACYAPTPPAGSPCDPGACPSGLVCSPATHTCEVTAVAPDAPADTASAADAPAGAWLAGYAHRKRITIVSSLALARFPVSLIETADADLAGSTGSDVVFTAADATSVLPSEVVALSASGALDAWFAMTIAPGSNVAYMYWGGPAATRTSPWDAATYAGVWHMSAAGTSEPDSAAGHDVSAPTAATTPTSATGIAGGARAYDGVDDHMGVADPSDGSLDFGTSSFSYEVWVDVTASAGTFDIPLWKGGSSLPEPGYDMELGTSAWNAGISDGTVVDETTYGQETLLLGGWHQLTAVVDRAAGRFRSYVDGVQVSSVAISGVLTLSNSSPLQLGNPTDVFHGLLDEVRIYKLALAPAWITATHANLADRAGYISIGPAESP